MASIIFSIYYLFAAEQGDEKARKIRSTLTVDHLRVSWNKSSTPYLSMLSKILRPRLARYPPRAIRIPRPPESSYKEPVSAWLYFDGPLSALLRHNKVLLDIPGGGFVAMTPRNHDDKLLAWAGKTGLPVLSLDYKKAPEHPYPYSLNECYDVYHTLIASKGRCIGLSGQERPRVVLSGDSAGGNLAAGVILMILQAGGTDSRRWQGEETVPIPDGLILIYPGLDMNIGNWMTDQQMSLIKDRRMRNTNRNVLRRKSEVYSKLAPGTPHPSDEDEDPFSSPPTNPADTNQPSATQSNSALAASHPSASQGTPAAPQQMKTRLAMSSMISYFNDRILTPEMMRAMIILYVGPHNRPDFTTDFLLSPLLAPEALLARFPKTYFLTGERDPLVDDTVIFAGRLRQAHYARWLERRELGLEAAREFEERDHVEVVLVPGISHGFLQFVGVFPEGWRYIFRVARWTQDIFAPAADAEGDTQQGGARHHRRAGTGTESSGDEDRPLEMSMVSSSSSGPAGKAHAQNGHARKGKDRDGRRGAARRSHNHHADTDAADESGAGWDSKRSKSSVSLASEDDLLGRRMKGLAGGLMGMTNNDDVAQ